MNPKKILSYILPLTAAVTTQSLANTANMATVTAIDGDVKVFSYPSKTAEGPAPRALFEGEYYSVHNARIGEKIGKGNIVRANPGAKAKVVYDNGDQFNVGGGTAYRITWNEEGKTDLNLMYGKVRGVVSKDGPRSGKLYIRTKSATMGVRGTDFFIADDGKNGTEVSVLRGKVEVTKNAPIKELKAGEVAPEPKKVEVTQGQTVTVEKKVDVKKTTQEELKAIVTTTTTKTLSESELKKSVGSEELAKVTELEKKAVDSTLQDIKTYDPTLYTELKGRNLASVAEVNTKVAEKLTAEAPSAPKKRKPFRVELENLGSDVYKKYFKEI